MAVPRMNMRAGHALRQQPATLTDMELLRAKLSERIPAQRRERRWERRCPQPASSDAARKRHFFRSAVWRPLARAG
jgi:hypothetical protein